MPERDPNYEVVKQAIHDANPPQWPTLADQRENLDRKAAEVSTRHHQWKQRGPWLECGSCPEHHGQFIGIDKRLTGIDANGRPIIMAVSPSPPR